MFKLKTHFIEDTSAIGGLKTRRFAPVWAKSIAQRAHSTANISISALLLLDAGGYAALARRVTRPSICIGHGA